MVATTSKPRKVKVESVTFRLTDADTQVLQLDRPVTTSGVRISPCAKSKDNCVLTDTTPDAELSGEKMTLNNCRPGPGSLSEPLIEVDRGVDHIARRTASAG
jgi:hypothetical protein